nr:arginine metabolism regulation protein ii [Quercus suber]
MTTITTTRRNRIVEGSCWTCRKRRVKCDLVKPSCTRCQTSGETCGYGAAAPVKWVGGVALRGRNATMPQLRRDSSSSSSASTEEIGCSPELTMLATVGPKPLEDDGLMLYFANALLPRFMLGETLFQADLKDISQDEDLRHTVIAVSQVHHSFENKALSIDAIKAGRKARQVAIRRLRKRLGGTTTDKAAQDVFATVVLLCILDGMIEPSEDENASVCHLSGGHAILGRWTNIAPSILMTTGLQPHLLSLFATMDLVQAILSGAKPYFDPESWDTFAEKTAWFGRLPLGHRFLGITKALSQMASSGHLIYSSTVPLDIDEISALFSPVSWDESTIDALLDPERNVNLTSDQTEWETFCSIWEIALVMYHRRVLRRLPVNHPEVQAATQIGFSRLLDERLPPLFAHCTILPLLIVGAHAMQPEQQATIRRALSSSASYLSFGSLMLMSKFLNDTWESSDMQVSWWTMFETIARKTFLF